MVKQDAIKLLFLSFYYRQTWQEHSTHDVILIVASLPVIFSKMQLNRVLRIKTKPGQHTLTEDHERCTKNTTLEIKTLEAVLGKD